MGTRSSAEDEARRLEKDRLQDLVQDLLDSDTGATCVARYSIANGLRRFLVAHASTEASCEFTDIEDIFGIEEGEERFSRKVLESLDPASRVRLCGIRHR